MKKNKRSKTSDPKRKKPQVPKKPDKQWDTLKDSESLKEKAPPVKYPNI